MKPLRKRAPITRASSDVLVPRAGTEPIRGIVILPAESTM
jgi:hypothetical protein